jgi:hypothetical protein
MASVFAPMDARQHPGDCSPDWWRAGAVAEAERQRQEQEQLAQAEREQRIFFRERCRMNSIRRA